MMSGLGVERVVALPTVSLALGLTLLSSLLPLPDGTAAPPSSILGYVHRAFFHQPGEDKGVDQCPYLEALRNGFLRSHRRHLKKQ